MRFNINYKIGNGHKLREIVLESTSKTEATKQFFLSPPSDNCVLVSIEVKEEIIDTNKIGRNNMYLMKIENTFEQFLFDRLIELNLTNNTIIEALSLNKNSWLKYRQDPINMTLKRIIKLAKVLKMDWHDVANQAMNFKKLKT